MKKLTNKLEVMATLTDMLIDLELQHSDYQNDIYLYVDEDGNGTLDIFPNVGGNSWRADDHYTIYRDTAHYESTWDNELFSGDWSVSDWLESLDMTAEEFISEMISQDYWNEDEYTEEDIEVHDIRNYIRDHENKKELMIEYWKEWIRESRSDYEDQAIALIEEYENN